MRADVGGAWWDSRVLVLRRPAPVAPHIPVLDASQRAVVEHRGPVLRVLGAPGTGLSTVAVEVVAERVERGEVPAGSCLLLAPTRLAAA